MPFTRSQKLGAAGVGLFLLAAAGMIGAYALAKQHLAQRGGAPGAHTVTVAVGDKSCDPQSLSVPAGKVTFRIVNRGSRALEWEILKGVMVVDERENIAPGLTQTLTTTLQPGVYAVTCGLVGNAAGTLTVTGAKGPAVKPSLVELIGPLAEYKVLLTGEADGLVEAATQLTEAVGAADWPRARTLYGQARDHYARLRPFAGQFAELDRAIDGRDGAPGSLRVLGLRLAAAKMAGGPASPAERTAADRLLADATALQERVATLPVPPEAMVGAARALIDGADAEPERAELGARVDGAAAILDLLHPLTERAEPALDGRLTADLATLHQVVASRSAVSPGPADAAGLRGPLDALAADLSALPGALGLPGGQRAATPD